MADILNGGFLANKKTHITAGLAVLSTIAAYLTGDLTLMQAAPAVFGGLSVSFLRNAIAQVINAIANNK